METPDRSVSQFEELMQRYQILLESNCEKEFLRFISNQELLRLRWNDTINDCKMLKERLDAANKNVGALNSKLSSARQWLDSERLERRKLELEKNALLQQLDEVRCILLTDSYLKLPDEIKEKLSFLRGTVSVSSRFRNLTRCDRIKTSMEPDFGLDSSDISVSRSVNDLDDLATPQLGSRKNNLSCTKATPQVEEPESSGIPDRIRPITPCYKTSSPFDQVDGLVGCEDKENYRSSAVKKISSRTHNFISKAFLMPEYCSWCCEKVGFRHNALKCSNCHVITHTECSDKIPLPCTPMVTTPVKHPYVRFISDYAPSSVPMIPAIVIRCVDEIERRGLNQPELYRKPGIKSCTRELIVKFSSRKNMPNLADFDTYSICHCLLHFLRNLDDSLIPRSKLLMFAEAVTSENKNYQLCTAISSLPQANRDTLAFIVLHLQNVVFSSKCRMSALDLASVFGPVTIGCLHDEQLGALIEKHTADTIMEELILLPAYYWSRFISPSLGESRRVSPTYCALSPVDAMRTPCKIPLTPISKKRYFNTSPPI